jgi:hypothetical protein
VFLERATVLRGTFWTEKDLLLDESRIINNEELQSLKSLINYVRFINSGNM